MVGWSLNELSFGRRDCSLFMSCISLWLGLRGYWARHVGRSV